MPNKVEVSRKAPKDMDLAELRTALEFKAISEEEFDALRPAAEDRALRRLNQNALELHGIPSSDNPFSSVLNTLLNLFPNKKDQVK